MAGGVEITGARVTWPTGLGFRIREHRENERERANTSKPRNRPEGKAGAADTMAGGREHSGARETGTRHHETQIKRLGEVKGIMGSLIAGKDGDGDGSVTAGRAEVRTAAGGASPCVGCGRERGRNWSGAAGARERGLGSYLSRPRSGGGRSHDASRGRRLLQRRARAVAEPRGEGDGADRWGPGWQRLGAGGAWAVGGRVGRRGLLGRTVEARDRAGAAAGLGCGAGPRGKKWPWGRMRGRGGMEGIFLFLFINKIFKLIFKRFLKSFSI